MVLLGVIVDHAALVLGLVREAVERIEERELDLRERGLAHVEAMPARLGELDRSTWP